MTANKPTVAVKAKAKGGGRKPPTQYFKAGTWVCPRCNNTVEIAIKMTAPPSCSNHKGDGITVMEWRKK